MIVWVTYQVYKTKFISPKLTRPREKGGEKGGGATCQSIEYIKSLGLIYFTGGGVAIIIWAKFFPRLLHEICQNILGLCEVAGRWRILDCCMIARLQRLSAFFIRIKILFLSRKMRWNNRVRLGCWSILARLCFCSIQSFP